MVRAVEATAILAEEDDGNDDTVVVVEEEEEQPVAAADACGDCLLMRCVCFTDGVHVANSE